MCIWRALQRWRWRHGVLTGRWTQDEVDEQREWARKMHDEIIEFFD